LKSPSPRSRTNKISPTSPRHYHMKLSSLSSPKNTNKNHNVNAPPAWQQAHGYKPESVAAAVAPGEGQLSSSIHGNGPAAPVHGPPQEILIDTCQSSDEISVSSLMSLFHNTTTGARKQQPPQVQQHVHQQHVQVQPTHTSTSIPSSPRSGSASANILGSPSPTYSRQSSMNNTSRNTNRTNRPSYTSSSPTNNKKYGHVASNVNGNGVSQVSDCALYFDSMLIKIRLTNSFSSLFLSKRR
jgi:hypothetical protein